MTNHWPTNKKKQTFIISVVGLVSILFLARAVDWRDAVRTFQGGVSPNALWMFSLMVFAILLIYSYRWRLLLSRRINYKTSLKASTLCLGGNMFLPARGGDLVRIQYSHEVVRMPHAEVVSRLFAEKIIDIVTITVVGVFALSLYPAPSISAHPTVPKLIALFIVTIAVFSAVIVRYFGESLLRGLYPLFKIAGRTLFFERYVINLLRDASSILTLNNMFLPSAVTLAMWLTVYAFSYILAAEFVGITISYPEALFVLFAGALGLMLPAAPSGVGTFHASIVSAFIFLGRSPADGLLVATAIHFLFFIAYVLPAGVIYARWRASRNIKSS